MTKFYDGLKRCEKCYNQLFKPIDNSDDIHNKYCQKCIKDLDLPKKKNTLASLLSSFSIY